MRRSFAAICLLAIAASVVSAQNRPANPLVGVWKIAEVVPDQGDKNSSPQPSVYIFTARHYSIMSVNGTTARPNHTGPNLTDAQRVEMWNPFTANSGTYEVKGTELQGRHGDWTWTEAILLVWN